VQNLLLEGNKLNPSVLSAKRSGSLKSSMECYDRLKQKACGDLTASLWGIRRISLSRAAESATNFNGAN
jgi:hypothetical protein